MYEAVKRIFTRINIKNINDFIDNITCMSDNRRKFYKEIINYRYEILRSIYYKLNKDS
ncbi:MAG: hypothetical protein IKD76_00475 [Clostridia bacterium]|nr:hypothetical protein [Clostridia bacterium]